MMSFRMAPRNASSIAKLSKTNQRKALVCVCHGRWGIFPRSFYCRSIRRDERRFDRGSKQPFIISKTFGAWEATDALVVSSLFAFVLLLKLDHGAIRIGWLLWSGLLLRGSRLW
jgi:hypothetical protein